MGSSLVAAARVSVSSLTWRVRPSLVALMPDSLPVSSCTWPVTSVSFPFRLSACCSAASRAWETACRAVSISCTLPSSWARCSVISLRLPVSSVTRARALSFSACSSARAWRVSSRVLFRASFSLSAWFFRSVSAFRAAAVWFRSSVRDAFFVRASSFAAVWAVRSAVRFSLSVCRRLFCVVTSFSCWVMVWLCCFSWCSR